MEIMKIQTNQLDEVVKNSGLAIQEGEEIKKSYLPFLNQLAEIQSQASKINFDNPTQLDEEIAGKLRKATVKIRTGASDLKDERKRIFLLKGNLEQAAYNLIAASCKLAEETFTQVEKAREIAEKKRQEQLRIERLEAFQPYIEFMPTGYDFGMLDEQSFKIILDGAKLQLKMKIEAEQKAEAERIAREKAEAEERERIRKENERLKAEAAEKERLRKIELEKIEKEREAERKKQAEILAKQQAESAEKARIEAEKQAKIQAELKAKAEAERKEKERIEKELKAKAEAESNALKEKQEAERKAVNAPDKQKIESIIKSLNIEKQQFKSKEAELIFNDILQKFDSFKNWALQQTVKLT